MEFLLLEERLWKMCEEVGRFIQTHQSNFSSRHVWDVWVNGKLIAVNASNVIFKVTAFLKKSIDFIISSWNCHTEKNKDAKISDKKYSQKKLSFH